MSKSTFEAELAQSGVLIYPNVGTSMMPLLRQGKDLMIIHPRTEERLQKYDVVLFRRGEQYVLHRILKVGKTDYILCGDHQWKKESGVRDEQILGVLTAVVRDGREIPVTDRRYRLYVHLWCDFFPIRAFILYRKAALDKVRDRMASAVKRWQNDRSGE